MKNFCRLSIFLIALSLTLPSSLSFAAAPAAAAAKTKKAEHHAHPVHSDLRAMCYRLDQDGQALQGKNTESKVEIGSVSKIFTSYWALSVRGASYRFETLVYLRDLGNGFWNVHLKGSRDPYFGKTSLQMIMVDLNQLGIKKIKNLSFDENLKYIDTPESEAVAISKLLTSDPQPNVVRERLMTAMERISRGYSDLEVELKKDLKLDVNQNLSMSAENVLFVSQEELASEKSIPTAVYSYRSVELPKLLKEMNRNSNNYAANNVFESLGGREEFKKFISASMNMTYNDVLMLNGSGDHFYEDDSLGHYNEATCDSIVKVLHALRAKATKLNLKLTDIMAVVGDDSGATVNVYENDFTKDSVVAKTGTVDPGVALAGLASTKDGTFLFASVFGPGDTAAERNAGRGEIDDHLKDLIRKNGGPVKLSYHQKSFLPFDRSSSLTLQQPISSATESSDVATEQLNINRVP
jgi:D-alanyl-D-alanine carboxypeptidase/D-alanyl-D-alanine-endopeptidase (penicillin-binding protein 4)